MSLYSISGAIESGLLYGLLALGMFISFRVMKAPDLTVDGSFTTGAAVSAIFTFNGMPMLGLLLAIFAGMCAGVISSILHSKLKVPTVLAGILTMTALYSINLRIMNNQAYISLIGKESIFSYFSTLAEIPFGNVILPLMITSFLVIILILFFGSHTGLAVRATGDNPIMVRSSSINTNMTKTIALAISNGLVALSGALIAQQQNYAEVNMGAGAIVLGLASLILGETLIMGRKSIVRNLIAAVIGAILFRLFTAFVLKINFNASDLKLLSALVVTIAISLPLLKEKVVFKIKRKENQLDVTA